MPSTLLLVQQVNINLQSTWDSVAPAQYKGVSPAQAPESVQDAAAVKLYNTAGPSQWVTA